MITLSEKEVQKMVVDLRSAEENLNNAINERKQRIDGGELADPRFLPIYTHEIKLFRRSLIGVQTALLNLESWLYEQL